MNLKMYFYVYDWENLNDLPKVMVTLDNEDIEPPDHTILVHTVHYDFVYSCTQEKFDYLKNLELRKTLKESLTEKYKEVTKEEKQLRELSKQINEAEHNLKEVKGYIS